MKEIRSLRTKTSKTYDLGEGKRRIVIDPTLTVQPSAKDSFLYEVAPSTEYGAAVDLMLNDRLNYTARAILEFDISGLPGGATLSSATLQLYYPTYGGADPNGKTVWAYKLTRTDWIELEANWTKYQTFLSWTSAGGDYVTSDPSGGSTTFPASYGWMSWAVLAIVQDAYDSSVAAEFLVKFATEGLSSGYSWPRFWSNDYTVDTSLCPKLVIDYTVGAVGRSFGYIMG